MQIHRSGKQIHWAAKRGDLQAVRRELGRCNVDARDFDGETPLMCATQEKRSGFSVVKALVEAGADVNATAGMTQATPLLLAGKSGRPEIVNYLLEAGANANFVSAAGYTAITNLPCWQTDGHLECLRLLLDAGTPPDARSPWDECAVRTALHWSNFIALALLLKHGASRVPAEMESLAWAVALGTLEDVERELDAGGDLSARDSWELTPWLLSLKTGEVAKAELLLKRGASFDERGKCGQTNLACAASVGRAKMVRWLLSHGAQVDATDEFGRTALQSAARHGAAECARALLDSGASMDVVLHGGDRSEPIIASAKNIATVEVFREHGADINGVSGVGYWLLKTAAESGDVEFARELLKAGASVDHTFIGDTALHAAASSDELEVVSLLLEHGADPNTEDLDFDTPMALAASQECLDLLLAAGGEIRPEDEISFEH